MGSEQDVTQEAAAAATAERDPGFVSAEPTLPAPRQASIADVVEQVLVEIYGDATLVESDGGSASESEYSGGDVGTLTYAVPYLLEETQSELLFGAFMSRGAMRGDPQANGYDCEDSDVGFCIEIDVDYPTYIGTGPAWLEIDLDTSAGLIRIGHGLLPADEG